MRSSVAEAVRAWTRALRRAAGGRRPVLGLAALYIVFGAVPLLLLAHFALSLADSAVREQVRHRLMTTADTSGVVVQQRLGALGDLVTATARDQVLDVDLPAAGRPANVAALDERLRQMKSSQPGITEALITDMSGRILAGQPGTEYFHDVSRTDWFNAVRAKARTYVSAAYTPSFPGAHRAIAIAAPAYDTSGKPVAILVAAYSLNTLQNFTRRVGGVQGINLLITDQTGVVVAQPQTDVSLIVSLIADPRIATGLAGHADYTSVHTQVGTMLSATKPVPTVGWTATATVGEVSALAPLIQLRSTIFWITALLIGVLLVGLCAQVWLSWQRSRAERRVQSARDEAVRTSELKSRLLAVASHEIRTPMNGILGMTRLLRGTDLDTEQWRYVEAAETSAASLLTVVGDLLDLSHIEAGMLTLTPAPFDLRRLCAEVVELLLPRAHEQRLALHAGVDPLVPAVMIGDADRIRQVLVNLVANAVKFTPSGQVDLRVSVNVHSGETVALTFTVADTGVGLSDEQRAHAFDRFARFVRPGESVEGAGLGLTISHELVTLMGGQIGVDSTPGSGSRFWFQLQLPRGHQDADASPALARQEAQGGAVLAAHDVRRGTLLLADDDPVNRQVAYQVLRRAGFDVDLADDGRAAVAMALDARYDAIIMDVYMPGMDGVAAVEAIRAAPGEAAGTPVLAMTASATLADRERCLAAGMDGFVAKPVDWEHLVAELQARTPQAPAAAYVQECAAPADFDEQVLGDLRACGALEDAFAMFVDTAPQVVIALWSALQRDDLATVAGQAHRLAGAAATIGAHLLADKCVTVEVGAARQSPTALASLIQDLSAQIESTVCALRAQNV